MKNRSLVILQVSLCLALLFSCNALQSTSASASALAPMPFSASSANSTLAPDYTSLTGYPVGEDGFLRFTANDFSAELEFSRIQFIAEFDNVNEGFCFYNKKENTFYIAASVGGQFGSVLKCTFALHSFSILDYEIQPGETSTLEISNNRIIEIGKVFYAIIEKAN